MKKLLFILFYLPFVVLSQGPYKPNEGAESIGVHKDSEFITSWATNVSLNLGSQQVGVDSSIVSAGDAQSTIGKADGFIVSLGDGGSATLTFSEPVKNNPGYDFAVFENGFSVQTGDYFLELAFVEVSSDGINFVRFPAISNTDTVILNAMDPTKIHNFAGKHLINYGTPFDLEELKDSVGIDINNVTHIKVIDVIGTSDSTYASKDSEGNIVLDPFPTPFNSSGFDLDAVAILSGKPLGVENLSELNFNIQNPVENWVRIKLEEESKVCLVSTQGAKLISKTFPKGNHTINVSNLIGGIYILFVEQQDRRFSKKLLKL